MALNCSVQGNVRTARSPPYRLTIRVNVLHGRKSINCANRVLPVFMARSSPAEGRRGRHGIQIDTTDSDQKSEHYPPVIGDPRSANRTPVALTLPSIGSAWAQGLPAGTMAPVYGTAWSAAQAGSHSSNTPNLASEQSKTGRVEAARTPDSHVRLSFHRTGGG